MLEQRLGADEAAVPDGAAAPIQPAGVTQELSRLMRMEQLDRHASDVEPSRSIVVRLGHAMPDASWLVPCGAKTLRATKAVSCLVEPMPGDRVQLLVAGDEQAWILAVLERQVDVGEVVLDAGANVLRLKAAAVEIQAGAEVAIRGQRISHFATAITDTSVDKNTTVTGCNMVQVGSMVIDSERHLRVHSKLVTVTADTLLKMDAAQIHMG